MVSLEKLLRIMQGIGKKYKNIGLEKFRLSIYFWFENNSRFSKFLPRFCMEKSIDREFQRIMKKTKGFVF